MGKPATAYFCKNGHLLDAADHHCFCQRDDEDPYKPCEICGAEVKCQFEWGDQDYEQYVPIQGQKNDKGETIYDVSKLFARRPNEA